MELIAEEIELSAADWWRHHRRPFNMTLISNAPISFAGLLLLWFAFGFRLPCIDLTFFIIFFGALFFIIALPLANLAYRLGHITEERMQPEDIATFRRRLYATGIWFWLFIIFLPVLANIVWLATGHSLTEMC
jgi:hypothetical protein